MKRGLSLVLFWLFACLGITRGFASDTSRELSYQEVMSKLKLREIVELTAGDQRFSALFNDAPKNPEKKAVLILHDIGEYPDQQPVIRNLRLMLPEHRWSALSLQAPIREAGAKLDDYFSLFPEAAARTQAGFDFLTKQGFKTIVIIGYGLGGAMALYTVAEKNLAVKAVVAISLPVIDDTRVPTLSMLKKISIPLMDIYAERDAETVSLTAKDRQLAAKDNANYRQLRLDGEDHQYQHEQGLLVKRIYSWLNTVITTAGRQ